MFFTKRGFCLPPWVENPLPGTWRAAVARPVPSPSPGGELLTGDSAYVDCGLWMVSAGRTNRFNELILRIQSPVVTCLLSEG